MAGGYLFASPLATDGPATLPLITPAVPSEPTIDGTTTTLSDTGNAATNATNLQNAINSTAALNGNLNHKIILPAGANFTVPVSGVTGNRQFNLPNKSGTNPTGTGWIIITSDGTLPADGTRQTASATQLANINLTAASSPESCFIAAASAHHYWLRGLNMVKTSSSTWKTSSLVILGGAGDISATQPHHFIINHCWLHGQPDSVYISTEVTSISRAVAINCGWAVFQDNWISEIHHTGADAQALGGWNGTGPYLIQNNHLEGTGENVMFGGSDPGYSGLIPSDITIRNNYMYKPPAWWQNDLGYVVKNLFELKTAQRVLVENNVMENHWTSADSTIYNTHLASGQTKAVNLKSNNQADSLVSAGGDGRFGTAGQDWSVTNDVTFRWNIIHSACGGLTVAGNVSDPGINTVGSNRWSIHDNLFYDIGSYAATVSPTYLISGSIQTGTGPNYMSIINNTFAHNYAYTPSDGTYFWGFGDPTYPGSNLIFKNNIIGYTGDYGVKGDGGAAGSGSINSAFPTNTFTGNVISGPKDPTTITWPSGNTLVSTQSNIGYTDLAGKDFSLAGGSTALTAGVGGTRCGADIATLLTRTAGIAV